MGIVLVTMEKITVLVHPVVVVVVVAVVTVEAAAAEEDVEIEK